ncbi:MAG: hypothetical protein V7K15_00380 [Nostoc sp.]
MEDNYNQFAAIAGYLQRTNVMSIYLENYFLATCLGIQNYGQMAQSSKSVNFSREVSVNGSCFLQ